MKVYLTWLRSLNPTSVQAFTAGEIPVGAVLVCDEKVVARAHNLTEGLQSPIAHAELLCLQQAAAELGGWRLLEACLYVTLEPCPMCAGAVLQARLKSVIYGARSSRLGVTCTWEICGPIHPCNCCMSRNCSLQELMAVGLLSSLAAATMVNLPTVIHSTQTLRCELGLGLHVC